MSKRAAAASFRVPLSKRRRRDQEEEPSLPLSPPVVDPKRAPYEAAAARLTEQRKTEIQLVVRGLAASPTEWYVAMDLLDPRTEDDMRYVTLLVCDTWTRDQRGVWAKFMLKNKTGEEIDEMLAEEEEDDS